jgi:hypothetical protein
MKTLNIALAAAIVAVSATSAFAAGNSGSVGGGDRDRAAVGTTNVYPTFTGQQDRYVRVDPVTGNTIEQDQLATNPHTVDHR